MLTCQMCGQAFERTSPRGPVPKWCSSACANRSYRRRLDPTIGQSKKCIRCGVEFIPIKSGRYCTESCMKSAYYEDNQDKLDNYRLRWSKVNRKLQGVYASRSRAKRPEYYLERRRFYQNRRRVRKLKGSGSHSFQEWMDLVAFYNGHCLCCGRLARLTVDHVIPIAKGGSDSIDNVQPLCINCNRLKQTTIMDFRLVVAPFVYIEAQVVPLMLSSYSD